MNDKHIVVVDDDELNRDMLSLMLQRAGYEVTAARNGNDALKKIGQPENDENTFDLLLTDMMMPGLSGMELIDRLKKMEQDIPVLAMTSYGHKSMIVELMRKGCSDFIEKPINEKDLLHRIQLVFEKTEKARIEKNQNSIQLIAEKEHLNRKIEFYEYQSDKLKKQINSAVNAYQSLVQIQKDGYRVAAACYNQPLSSLGGDYIDIQNTPTGCDVLIADVSGHDMGASYHAVLLNLYFKENCKTGNSGSSFFQLLNRKLLENCSNERMVTGIFLRLNLETMTGEAVSAGHPPFFAFESATKLVSLPADLKGDVLGVFEDVSFNTYKFSLERGNRLFLYTDGLTDAYNVNINNGKKEILGQHGLCGLIQKHGHLSIEDTVEQIRKEVNKYSGFVFKDDILLLGLEIP